MPRRVPPRFTWSLVSAIVVAVMSWTVAPRAGQVPLITVPQATVPKSEISATAAVRGGALESAISGIDRSITADFARDGVGAFSIGIVSGTQLIWSKHYGYADADTRRRPDNNTDYRIGSVTKQFTALAMLQLVEQHRMRLSDALETYVPEVKQVMAAPIGTPPITLLQVATMHAGLAREPECANSSVGPVTAWEQIVVACLPQTRYVNEPGTTYLYSNFGYATLGLAIERAGSQPFIDQVRERILSPLGMSRSAMDATTTVRENLAHGYQRAADGTASHDVADQELNGRGYRVPNGALFSTINDLAKFVSWELGDGPAGILNKATQDANYARAFFYNAAMTDGYGVGFYIERYGDVVLLGHGGSTAGYTSSLLVHRPTHLGVIMLRSCDSCTVSVYPLAEKVLEQLVLAKGSR